MIAESFWRFLTIAEENGQTVIYVHEPALIALAIIAGAIVVAAFLRTLGG